MNTSPLQRSISNVFPNRSLALATEVVFLLLLGVVAMAVHSAVKLPMHLPGKQGLLFIALVVTGRGISSLPFAGSITCLGAATTGMLPALGFANPFMPVTYILLGVVMDLIYGSAARYSPKPWILAIASGIAWMFMPLFRLTLSLVATLPVNMFSSGYAYPFFTHLLFGFTGGLIGAGIITLLFRKKTSQE